MSRKETIKTRHSIRTRLLLLFLGLTTVTLIVSGYLAVSTLLRATNSAQQISQSALKTQAAEFMVQIVEKTAQQNDAILTTIYQDANYLAFYASDIFANSRQFHDSSQWRAADHMVVRSDGQFANDENDTVSVYIPNTIVLNEDVIFNLELSSHLDLPLQSIYESSENITAVYLSTEDEITRYYPNINLGVVLPPNFKVSQRPWYTNAVQENPERQVVWSEIYEDATGQGLLVTAAIPVYHVNTLIGAIGIDVSLDDIQTTVENTQLFENGYTFLIDETGQVIVLPEQGYFDIFNQSSDNFERTANLKGGSTRFGPVTSAMLAGETGFKEIINEDDVLFVAYAPLQSTGWSLATVVPSSELLKAFTVLQQELAENTRQLVFTRLLSSSLFLLVLTVLIGFWATSLFVNPVRELVAAVQKIGAGDWTTSLPKIRKDEIGVLTSTFQDVTNQLHDTLNGLEQRVDERTRDLERRAVQLEAAAQIAHDALVFQNVNELLSNVTHLISEKFKYYHAGIFLLDDKGNFAVLQAASSEGGRKMLGRGHQLQVGSEGIVGAAAAEKRPHIALDVGVDAVFFNNPDLPETRSEMALPLLTQNDVLGVLDIQSTEKQAFTQQDIEIFQTLANQIALAIQNARLIEEAQVNIARLESLAIEQTQMVWESHLENRSRGFFYTPLGVKPLKAEHNFHIDENEAHSDVPIMLRGKKIGKIALKRMSRQWTKKEKALLSDVADQVGLAIENARLVSETREQANRDQLVSGFSSKLRETLDMDTVVKTALAEMRKTFNLQEVEVRLNTPDENEVED